MGGNMLRWDAAGKVPDARAPAGTYVERRYTNASPVVIPEHRSSTHDLPPPHLSRPGPAARPDHAQKLAGGVEELVGAVADIAHDHGAVPQHREAHRLMNSPGP